ncbi:F-box protein [Vitis vinifera]|uniref:F-box protein n=1 Tax=Vitis vinifera TaxID=29760 RepID=A0A438CG11_VITVI|nr:F-box protein [Vitis vinifera]
MEETEARAGGDLKWSRETIPKVLRIVGTRLPQRDLISLLLVSPWIHRTLVSCSSLWLVLDFRETNNAGNRLVAALSLVGFADFDWVMLEGASNDGFQSLLLCWYGMVPFCHFRYQHVKQINLEFAQDIEDKHLDLLKTKCLDSLQELESLNLNVCQKISDRGVETITSACPKLKVFSIYWNVRVTDIGMTHLVKNCKHIVDLNLSGCKNITDKSLQLIADNYPDLELLNLTRCIKLTDGGLQQILLKCSSLQSLNLYALSSFTDEAYKKISLLTDLRFLDLCGAQNLSDQGLCCIAKCKNLVSLNLTWCVRVTDVGVIAIAQGCTSLEFLSLFGIVGVTDKCLEALSRSCSNMITTLDVNGCIGIKGIKSPFGSDSSKNAFNL